MGGTLRAIVTGARGTLGAVLCQRIVSAGGEAIPWDRARVPIDDYGAMEHFVRESGASAIFHLALASKPTGIENEGWLVNWQWPSELAWIARQLGVPFVYTSTVMVYTNAVPGPRDPATPADETEGYGAEKRRAEEQVLHQNPGAIVARLGWQIGSAPGTNNMIDFLERTNRESGAIRASTRWIPACSFLEDTADALLSLPGAGSGIHHVEGNSTGLDFHRIATGLNALHGNRWRIVATDDFVLDQRLRDTRVPVGCVEARLPPAA